MDRATLQKEALYELEKYFSTGIDNSGDSIFMPSLDIGLEDDIDITGNKIRVPTSYLNKEKNRIYITLKVEVEE